MQDSRLFLARIVRVTLDDRVTFLAASIAFYAFISIFPLLLLVLVIGSLVAGEAFADRLVATLSGVLTPEAEDLVVTAVLEGAGRSGAGVVGSLFLLWSGLRVFRGLDIAFAMIYGADDDSGFLKSLIRALAVIVGILLGLIALFVLQTAAHVFPIPVIWQRLSMVPIFFVLLVMFFPMYLVLPSPRPSALAVLPGTAFAAAGWTVLGELFAIYVAHAGTFALFGIVGGVLILMTWFYFGAILVLTGTVINAVLAGRTAAGSVESSESLPFVVDAEHPRQEQRD